MKCSKACWSEGLVVPYTSIDVLDVLVHKDFGMWVVVNIKAKILYVHRLDQSGPYGDDEFGEIHASVIQTWRRLHNLMDIYEGVYCDDDQ